MKKRLLPALLALVMVLGLLPGTAFASDETLSGTNITASGGELSAGTYIVPQNGITLTASLVIKAEGVTIDLNGQTLTGPSGQDAIKVESTGSLTIKDSKATAIPTMSESTIPDGGKVIGLGSGACALSNEGTVVVEGGIFTTQNGNASAYAIWNGHKSPYDTALNASEKASMSFPVNSTALVARTDNYTAICNKNSATMEIWGGAFWSNNNIVLKSDHYATLKIHGGTFSSGSSSTDALKVFWDTEIDGGTFNGNVASASDNKDDGIGNLTISGGTFEGTIKVWDDYAGACKDAKLTITKKEGKELTIKGGLDAFWGKIIVEGNHDKIPKVFKVSDDTKVTYTGFDWDQPQGTANANGQWYTIKAIEPATATFDKVENETLGTCEVTQGQGTKSHEITVAGTANYVENYTEFSSNTNINDGHFLTIKITLNKAAQVTIASPNETKTVNVTNDDKVIDLTMKLDDIISKPQGASGSADEGTVTVTIEGDETPYVINVKGVVLAPKAGAGVKPAEPDAGSENSAKFETTDSKVSVTVPVNETTSETTVKIESKEQFQAADVAENTNETVKNAITGATKGITITVEDAEGKNVYGDQQGSDTLTVTYTFSKAGTFYLFCIRDGEQTDKKVTSWGKYEVSGTNLAITFNTPHLSTLVEVEEPTDDEQKTALDAQAKALREPDVTTDANDLAPSDTPATTGATYTRDTTKALNVITITGGNENANKYYIIQAASEANTAPALIYCVKAGSDGSATAYCNSSCVLTILVGTTEVPDFSSGIPDGLGEVTKSDA